MIESFYETDSGDLFAVNGIDNAVRWDGLKDVFEPVGLDAPLTALSMAGSTVGRIVGTYYAYSRFLDEFNNPSDLSPISATFTAQGRTGSISSITNATPLAITSSAHGLLTDAWVKISGVGGITGVNNTWQITVTGPDNFTLNESSGDGITEYTGGGTWQSGVGTITYSSVPVPVEAKVRRRQILRNTDGQATTFYVDVDTTDLSSASFTSSLTDSLLQSNESVPLLDSDGNPFANRNAKPLTFFKCVTQHLGLMFMAGLLEYNIGHCIVTFGSTSVPGVGTGWKATMNGRFLYVEGASQTYEISSVNEATQTITLTSPYLDATDSFAYYSIKPPPAYRRVVAFSVSGFPQSWPAFNGLSLQETGDEITGLMQNGAYLFILEREHIHKLTFARSPLVDGAVFMVSSRGCTNNRCWVQVDNVTYMLDELGIHKFAGNQEAEPVSESIASFFRGDAEDLDFRIDWRWREYFHAVLDRQRKVIRWFVSLDGSRYPRQILALYYPSGRWWIEKYPVCIGGAVEGYAGSYSGNPQVYYGGDCCHVYAAWTGPADLVDPKTGVTQSTGQIASSFTLTDETCTWPTSGMVNAPVAIIGGRGKGQERKIVSVSGQTMTVNAPWLVMPDSTSVYQIGGIPYIYRSNWFRLSAKEETARRRFEMLFEPQVSPTTARMQWFDDFSSDPQVQSVTTLSKDGGGIASTKDDADLIIDMTRKNGFVQRQFPYGKEYYSEGRHYSQFTIQGFTNADQVKLYQFLLEGFLPTEGG